MGPPPRSLTAEANGCFMVRVLHGPNRIQGCGASVAPKRGLPSDQLCRTSDNEGHRVAVTLDTKVLIQGCVKTCTTRECSELFFLFFSFDGDCQSGSFVIRGNRDKLSTRKFDVGVFTQPGSFPDLDAPERKVRFAPINGHRQGGGARPKSCHGQTLVFYAMRVSKKKSASGLTNAFIATCSEFTCSPCCLRHAPAPSRYRRVRPDT